VHVCNNATVIYRDNHAVVLLVGSTTSEKADDKTDNSDDNDEQWCAVDFIAEEGEVVFKRCLNDRAGDNEYQTDNLRISSSTSPYRPMGINPGVEKNVNYALLFFS